MSESGFKPVPEAIADRYGVVIPPRWERLLSDTTGGVFRGGQFVVRVEPADPESVRWEHALLRFLANEIEQVVAPLAALDGSTFYVDGGHVVSVFPFLEGEELRSQEALFRHELPVLLARLHRHVQAWPVTEQRPGVPSLRNRNWDRNDWWDWSLVEKPVSLVRAFEELREWVADADDLCVCAIPRRLKLGGLGQSLVIACAVLPITPTPVCVPASETPALGTRITPLGRWNTLGRWDDTASSSSAEVSLAFRRS